jgi:hypothetical protein
MHCDRGYEGQSEGGDEWEFDVHPTDKRWYEPAKVKQLQGCQVVRPNRRLGAMEHECRALLTAKKNVEMVANVEGQRHAKVKVNAVGGKAGAVILATMPRQRLQEEKEELVL